MITTSNSPVKRSGIPNQLLGVLLHTLAMSGLSRVRTELFQLLVIPSLAPHPVQANRQSPRHRDLGGLVKFLVQSSTGVPVDRGFRVSGVSSRRDSPCCRARRHPPALPPGGELSAYAVLQWAWLTKNSWRRKVLINDHSAVRDLARQLAELILGEAFV
jgi:hypothetical protein